MPCRVGQSPVTIEKWFGNVRLGNCTRNWPDIPTSATCNLVIACTQSSQVWREAASDVVVPKPVEADDEQLASATRGKNCCSSGQAVPPHIDCRDSCCKEGQQTQQPAFHASLRQAMPVLYPAAHLVSWTTEMRLTLWTHFWNDKRAPIYLSGRSFTKTAF